MDADTILPNRFIEENLRADADCVGESGCAMLIKMQTFIRVFNGRFAEVSVDDAYTEFKLLSQGYVVKHWILLPIFKGKPGAPHSWRYYFIIGIERYKLGYEPIHILVSVIYGLWNAFMVLGYLISMIKRIKRYDFAGWIFRKQLERLIFESKNLFIKRYIRYIRAFGTI